MEGEIWTVSGSTSPINTQGVGPHKGIDGYDVYILLKGIRYRLSNKQLEQYKIEEEND